MRTCKKKDVTDQATTKYASFILFKSLMKNSSKLFCLLHWIGIYLLIKLKIEKCMQQDQAWFEGLFVTNRHKYCKLQSVSDVIVQRVLVQHSFSQHKFHSSMLPTSRMIFLCFCMVSQNPQTFQCRLTSFFSGPNCALGPDRLELIIFDITGKKIDNDPCRLIISF